MESHSVNVRRLVDEFRSRAGDTRVDSGGMRRVWESLLRQVQSDAEAHLDLAAVLQQQLSRPTLEASFHRKLQSRKVIRRPLKIIEVSKTFVQTHNGSLFNIRVQKHHEFEKRRY